MLFYVCSVMWQWLRLCRGALTASRRTRLQSPLSPPIHTPKMPAMPYNDRHYREHPCKYIQKTACLLRRSQRAGGIMEKFF